MKYFVLLLWLLAESAASKPIRLEISVPLDSELAKELTTAFTHIFAKKDLQLVPSDFPTKRGLEEMKSGRIDGTMGRFGNLASGPQIKSMIRIEYPTVLLTFSMWCNRKVRSTQQPIVLGLRLGSTVMAMLDSALDRNRVRSVELNSYASAVQMLRSGRLDCILGNDNLMVSSGMDARELDEFTRKDLITAAGYAWISSSYGHLKGFLEKELKAYHFSEGWRKKFRTDKSVCKDSYDVLCPDGVVFTRSVDFKVEQPNKKTVDD